MESVLPPLIYTGKAMSGVAVGDAMPVSRPLWEPTKPRRVFPRSTIGVR